MMQGSGRISFEEVHREFRPRILHYVSRLAGHDDAEDIAQEAFEKINRGLGDFRGESKLSTWVYRIATNTALDRLRSPRGSEGALELEGAETQDMDVWSGQRKAPPDIKLIRREMNNCIRDFITRLPPDYKTVIVLSELEGLKNREIADILEVSVDTVKIRLHRARASLKKELQANCSFYRDERNVFSCDLKSALKKFRESN
jgi:RNA polymerase sigma-70 factor (ECF subfamily)